VVLHLVPSLFDEQDGVIGGAERYAFELARHMADAVPTSLVAFGSRAREEHVGPLRIRVIGDPWYVRGQRANPFAFAALGEVRRADIVHCHQQHILVSSVAAVTARLAGRRVYCTDLGGGGWDVSAFVSTDRLFDAHLHISEYSRHIAGHDAMSRAHVIWGGVDTRTFSPDAGAPHTAGVLFVGRLLPHKGVDTLLRALPADVPASIIGPAPDARYLADLLALAAGKQVTFHHACNDAALVDAYRRATCIVLPSVYDDMYGRHTDVPELLGQTLLEGMACATPAVCTAVASLPEIVEDGKTGFVVAPNDPEALRAALMSLVNSPLRARQLGEAARASIAARFTWPAVVQRCLRLYGIGEPALAGLATA
jgi:glycosyltransferase involved in cell wall biosynthesis